MHKIIRIARLELSLLFYSPIAWFLLIVFLFQCGLEYFSMMEGFSPVQELGLNPDALNDLTRKLFGPPFGIFSKIMGKLYLYLPLITMGLMSRELSSGTIKLLYSSPVKVRAIVLGKYGAMMVYNAVLMIPLLIIVAAAGITIHSADYGMLFSALLGLYLLLCAYAAIGLFMSSLTAYQVVAALSTLVVFAILNYVGELGQDIDLVRDITNFLSISGRTENMLSGLISSKDVLYYVVIIYLFLALSIYRLRTARESKPLWLRFGMYTGIVGSALLVGYLSSRPALIAYYDATATHARTLSPNTQQIVKEMRDEPLVVTSYINLLDKYYWNGRPDQRNADLARWESYLRFKPNIQLNYVYYYDTVFNSKIYASNPGKDTRAIADKFSRTYKDDLDRFKTPEQIRQLIDLGPEQNRYVIHLQYKDKSSFLRLYDDMMVWPFETETAAALKRLQVQLPRIAFLEGEGERDARRMGDQDYKILTSEISFRYALVNQGFDVVTIPSGQPIPDDIAVLVIADPKTAFSPEAMANIQHYINKGRNLLIAGEPGKQQLLNPLLQQFGVELMPGAVVQPGKDFAPDLVRARLTPAANDLAKLLWKEYRDSVKVTMLATAGLRLLDSSVYRHSPLLVTDAGSSWNRSAPLDKDAATVSFDAAAGDQAGPLVTALQATRTVNGRQQRIIITGDADYMSNAELGRQNIKTANFKFNTAVFGWFSEGQFPIDTSRPPSQDNYLNYTGKALKTMKWIVIGVLPGILALGATLLLIRRKRK
ncbi:MAG: Gldg family protein [Candidatus Pseudobacter hemicellulosilyticus]|uniref:Gldg family protein n=1 Tax=Candidatus Pseudobacter hemicellulosilyticus TaxID=3121375 RepID=A0AAJ6BGU4_9BACT|nr:MAG: Gldg family protein [Pseudobacter sp.]